MIDVRETVEAKVNSLWKEFKGEEFCRFSPHSIAQVPEEGLLFIGINPSLNKKAEQKLIERNDIKCEFHTLTNDPNGEYRYFRKFFEVSKKTNLDWGHIDILYNRETNQKKVEKILKTERGKDFIYKQCQITKEVLDKIIDLDKPRIFVVTNTLARNLLGDYHEEENDQKSTHFIGYDFIWDEELGTYTYKNNPFFFTSMLTGQRALDNGSFKRLVWHINFVKNKVG
ncbi:hypothetical protein [Mesonia aquimarina]|uniref:hypothetical protein n=1 Tax=Mesonia aquimarina TaxID=1504967 RepID=UPI000EF5FCBB|nr:hypothetical protein [Mesonia aquimarina]